MSKEVDEKYSSFPILVREKIFKLRLLIIKIAMSDESIDFLGEALKWGEPSFITKSSGSTIRIDWKKKNPDCLSIFFNCQTKLVSMFKEIYPNDFVYMGNREIRLPLNAKYSIVKLSKCIELALKYNRIKNNF